MFDKLSKLAMKVAENDAVTRRESLGRLAKAAMGAAGSVGAVLFLPGKAQAGNRPKDCHFTCPDGSTFTIYCATTGCVKKLRGCRLTSKSPGTNCRF